MRSILGLLVVACVLGCQSVNGGGGEATSSCDPLPGESPVEWPQVKHPEGLDGHTAQTLLDAIVACADEVLQDPGSSAAEKTQAQAVKDAATQRKQHRFFYPIPGEAVTPRQGWALVVVAWRLVQADEWSLATDQLTGHGFDPAYHDPTWGTTTYGPNQLGYYYLDELENRLDDPMYGAPPLIRWQLEARIALWKQTPSADPTLAKKNAVRWARTVSAYYGAGFGGDPNWYLCLDELQHDP